MLREKHKWKPHKCESTDAEHRGGATRSSDEGSVMELERRGSIVQLGLEKTTGNGRIGLKQAKPFSISKLQVWEAYKRVKANKGAAGVDGQTIELFDSDLTNNLYKLWNRLSSGSYFPPPVMRVEIPKGDGRMRPLGIPTVADRIAQMVVKQSLEPELEQHFLPCSYGYRPGKSALDAVGRARKCCWKRDWVLDLDIKRFFDNINHELMMKAVRAHTKEMWILLYVKRWLKAPVKMLDETLVFPEKGTPQGGVVSPLLANLFLHYAFDKWLSREYSDVPFERYADDAVCHCTTLAQAERLKSDLEARMKEVGLELHPEKTKIVYCKDDDRQGEYPQVSFDFLGYTFRARRSKNRWGKHFINFTPAISNKAAKAIRQKSRDWNWSLRSDKDLEDLAYMFNSTIRGWINYYGRYYKSALYPTLRCLDRRLVMWATRKYKRLRNHRRRATHWLDRIARKQPYLFAHWRLLYAMAGR
ncbi:group II intron reverse transcriptase/maturase [Desulforhopalus sp. IMCC35007]|uniref:group II intron reverse transcriptase/maturase n=1 Tax=Desulforhopalus sp. IMCC35007 TaxID=2569543 RepID=UPI0010ADD29C|nr:group II intron reverse transcriptase/maturase [Desulforhopalus sp. IMCC35007]